jgi:hypothetical protein
LNIYIYKFILVLILTEFEILNQLILSDK